MGKLQRAVTVILRRESKFPRIKSLVSTHSACLCKNYPPKCSQPPLSVQREYRRAAEPVRTIHVVAPPTIGRLVHTFTGIAYTRLRTTAAIASSTVSGCILQSFSTGAICYKISLFCLAFLGIEELCGNARSCACATSIKNTCGSTASGHKLFTWNREVNLSCQWNRRPITL